MVLDDFEPYCKGELKTETWKIYLVAFEVGHEGWEGAISETGKGRRWIAECWKGTCIGHGIYHSSGGTKGKSFILRVVADIPRSLKILVIAALMSLSLGVSTQYYRNRE